MNNFSFEESHQNVMLALLYWFRSVHLRNDGRGVHVKLVRRIFFSLLEQLSLEQALALKAFLVHATLTVEEYS